MPQYRKKPVVIDAFKWTGGPDQTDDPDWIVEAIKNGNVKFTGVATPVMCIMTLEGEMQAQQGDWIIRGVKGEIYPCKPDIFEATYDAAGALLGKRHEGLPVSGYKPQNQGAVDRVNENKAVEERLLRTLDIAKASPDVDQRWLAIARTGFEQAFMALNRSIFKPGRVSLPTDTDAA